VVAHFHFVLFGGLIFSLRAVYYCFEGDGAAVSERLGRWHFWLMVLGSTSPSPCTHPGRPRDAAPGLRIPPIEAGRSGTCHQPRVPVQALAIAIFVVNIIVSLRRGAGGRSVGWTLEWPRHRRRRPLEVVPLTTSRRPLWD
jgi:cytochrome c oxidase subunit 1